MSNIEVWANEFALEITTFKFPGGEIHVKIEDNELLNLNQGICIFIVANLCSSDDIMELLLVKDAIDRYFDHNKEVYLTIKYLAYGRQDRVSTYGEALSLSVIAKLINGCNFDSVELVDPHSDVSTALIDRSKVTDSYELYYMVGRKIPHLIKENSVLVSPDSGALKKVYKVAKEYGLEVIQASKHRNILTGEITGTTLGDTSHIPDISSKDLVIIDDICDGGRTFVELGKVLRTLTTGRVFLFVTHGIFSHPEGPNVFKGIFDKVFCYNVMFPEKHDSIKYPILVTNK